MAFIILEVDPSKVELIGTPKVKSLRASEIDSFDNGICILNL